MVVAMVMELLAVTLDRAAPWNRQIRIKLKPLMPVWRATDGSERAEADKAAVHPPRRICRGMFLSIGLAKNQTITQLKKS